MKKSNKILLGGLAAVLLLITAMHLTLYASYRKSAPAGYSEVAPGQAFQNIRFIALRNVSGATIRWAQKANLTEGMRYLKKGDTLLITGGENKELSLPSGTVLSLLNSSVSFRGSDAGGDPVVYLHRSNAFFFGENGPLRLGRMKLVASGGSSVVFRETEVGDLDIELHDSSLEDNNSRFGNLSLTTDSVSRISLPARHLPKATIKTVNP